MLAGLGPSLRWDDEFLRFRAVLIKKLMVEKWNEWFRNPCSGFEEAVFKKLLVSLGQQSGFTAEEFFYSEATWQQICESYDKYNANNSFIDYVWTIKAMHTPLLLHAADQQQRYLVLYCFSRM